VTINNNISISSAGYKKGDPQKNPDTAYIFTENGQAYIASVPDRE
jgi:hypothetical protein